MNFLKNKRNLLLVSTLTVSMSLNAFSQAENAANTDKNNYSNQFDYGQLEKVPFVEDKKSYEDTLYRVSLDTFEDGGNWIVSMPFDYGRAVLSMKKGVSEGVKNTPSDIQKLSGEDGSANAVAAGNSQSGYFVSKEDTKQSVLGVKVNFFGGRKPSPWIRIDAVQPLPMNGVVKGFEVWASGREFKHDLLIIIEDTYGKEQLVSMGSLNYLGWRKLTAQVPAYIKQQNSHNLNQRGITFKGFYVKFNMLDAMGTYYLYLDNLSAQISRYAEENQLKDDIRDNW